MKVLFYVLKLGPPNDAKYQHLLIVFAEGLEQLGIEFDANINYYKKKDGSYLFKEKKNINYNDYDYIVAEFRSGNLLKIRDNNSVIPNEIFEKTDRKYKTIILDLEYEYLKYINNSKYYDFYFRADYNNNILNEINDNIYPLSYSASNRIINATKNYNKFNDRKITLLYPHRLPHMFRKYILENVYNKFDNLVTIYNDNFKEPRFDNPHYLDWAQSGRRHNPKYYDTLKNCKMVDCTGGNIYTHNKYGIINLNNDNWKVWETFFAGACVIMINLEFINIKLSIQPINMVHYIGVTNDTEKNVQIFKDILDDKIDIEKIANEGKKWAMENYTPDKVAKYILDICEFFENKKETKKDIDILNITNFSIH